MVRYKCTADCILTQKICDLLNLYKRKKHVKQTELAKRAKKQKMFEMLNTL